MMIPRSFLTKVIGDLRDGDLLITQPGPHGGVSLGRASEHITLRQIVEAVEGPILLNSCLLQAGYAPLMLFALRTMSGGISNDSFARKWTPSPYQLWCKMEFDTGM